jgi:hypothetical protein
MVNSPVPTLGVEGMALVRWQTVDTNVESKAARIVGALSLMAIAANTLQSAVNEPLPRAAMMLDVVGDGCRPRETSRSAEPTARLDQQLMASPDFPTLQPVPASPLLRRMRGSARSRHGASYNHRLAQRESQRERRP